MHMSDGKAWLAMGLGMDVAATLFISLDAFRSQRQTTEIYKVLTFITGLDVVNLRTQPAREAANNASEQAHASLQSDAPEEEKKQMSEVDELDQIDAMLATQSGPRISTTRKYFRVSSIRWRTIFLRGSTWSQRQLLLCSLVEFVSSLEASSSGRDEFSPCARGLLPAYHSGGHPRPMARPPQETLDTPAIKRPLRDDSRTRSSSDELNRS